MTLRKIATGKLFVTVVEAADLIASSDGKSDPFCVIKVGDNQESATPVVKNDLNPKWNYTVSNNNDVQYMCDNLSFRCQSFWSVILMKLCWRLLYLIVIYSLQMVREGGRERERLEGSVIMLFFLYRFLGLC